VSDPASLGQEFVRWEVATAVAGGLLGINPFDEANVQEAKDATNAVLRGDAPEPPATVALYSATEALLQRVKADGYVAVLAYVERTPQAEEALNRLRTALAERTHLATTLGYGPRYLHSTGQLHKGGVPSGAFLLLIEERTEDVPIPGAAFTFGRLFEAQALGDATTLTKHGLPLVYVEPLSDAPTQIAALADAVRGSA
ncbi:MAG: glucose-6-phosphate isomerase, partial [Chloroflexi bacterium]